MSQNIIESEDSDFIFKKTLNYEKYKAKVYGDSKEIPTVGFGLNL